MHEPFEFSEDWFSSREDLWTRVLSDSAGQSGLRFLEVGVYEGRSAVWLLEHILTHPTARLDCVDPFSWISDPRCPEAPDMVDVEQRFHDNIARTGASECVRLIRRPSGEALAALAPQSYDLIYIDGSHRAPDVLTDAVLALRLLRHGGLLVFDDYLLAEVQGTTPSLDDPRVAIDAFLAIYAEHVELVWKGYQVMVRKRAPAVTPNLVDLPPSA